MISIKLKNYINLHILFLFYSLTIVVTKIASKYPFLSPKFTFYYCVELVMIAVYAYFWQDIIKKFSLGVAYSNKGVIIFWTLIWSSLLFQETINFNQIAGMVIIIGGICLVANNDK